MAIINFTFVKESSARREMDAKETEEYLKRERTDDSIEHYQGLAKDDLVDQFLANAKMHNSNSPNVGIVVVQSWDEKQSKMLDPSEFVEMGKEFMDKFWPDHRYYLRLHTETGKFHNHIFIDPVHPASGARIQNKKMWKDMVKLNDKICIEHGLPVLKSVTKEPSKNAPKEVQQIRRRGGNSYRDDIIAKSEWAGKVATSYDEYVATMGAFGIKTIVKPKNITYCYANRKQIRGDKLGGRYDKEYLEGLFKKNDEKFAAQPDLKRSLYAEIDTFRGVSGAKLGNAGQLLSNSGGARKSSKKDYSQFTNVKRSENPFDYPAIRELANSMVPVREITKARKGNVLDYAKSQGLEVIKNKKGRLVLEGRRHIIFTKDGWYNAKDKTHGSLIEFVAIHKDISYLRATAEITGNKRLLWLEKQLGKPISQFKSFHMPKTMQQKRAQSIVTTTRFLEKFSIDHNRAAEIFEKKKLQVSKKGVIRFFDDEGKRGFRDYQLTRDGNWKKGGENQPFGIFHRHQGSSQSVTVFGSPESYFSAKGGDSFKEKGWDSVLVLMDKNEDGLDRFLIENPQVKQVRFYVPGNLYDKERGFLSGNSEKYKSAVFRSIMTLVLILL